MGSLKALFLVSGAVVGMTSLAMRPICCRRRRRWSRRGAGIWRLVSARRRRNGRSDRQYQSVRQPEPADRRAGRRLQQFLQSLDVRFGLVRRRRRLSDQQLAALRRDRRISRRDRISRALEQVAIPSLGYQNADFYRGNVSSFIGLVNGYVDIGTWYGITPFVGAGVGFSNNRLSGLTDAAASPIPATVSASPPAAISAMAPRPISPGR